MAEPESQEAAAEETWGRSPSVERWRKSQVALPPYVNELEPYDYRMAISDDLKIGYVSTDRATQTDITEVLEIKQLTYTTQNLVKIIGTLQRDFNFLKTYLEMKFEDRLKEESMRLYEKLQMIIQEIVIVHEKNEDTMRKSFYKQLCDAIACIRGAYAQFFEIGEDTDEMFSSNAAFLRKKIKEKNELIDQLRAELLAYQEGEMLRFEALMEQTYLKIARLEKEIYDLTRENERLLKMIKELEEDLQLCEKANALLEGELAAQRQKMEEDQKLIQKLTLLKEKLKEDIEQEKKAVQDMLESQKEDIERTKQFWESQGGREDIRHRRRISKASYEERERLAGRRVRAPSSKTSEMMLEEMQQAAKAGHMLRPWPKEGIPLGYGREVVTPGPKPEERRLWMEEELTWKEGVDSKQTMEFQIKKLKKILEIEKKSIRRLKVDADRESKLWKKKYFILRARLHTLKDEMFTRQSFVRQFTMFSDASFNYNKVKPLYIQSRINQVTTLRKRTLNPPILPHIDSRSFSQISEDAFILSMPNISRVVISEEEDFDSEFMD